MADEKESEPRLERNEQDNNQQDLFTAIIREELDQDFIFEKKDPKEYKPYIIADKREERSNIPTFLEDLGATVIRKVIPTGDYIVSPTVALERKRGDDFYSSLFSGSEKTNIYEELLRLIDSVETPLLIIENFKKIFDRGEDKASSLYGAMVNIATELGIPIIPTRDNEDTALCIYRLAIQQQTNRAQKGIARRIPKQITLKQRQEYFLEGFYNVGPQKAKKIIETFKTPIRFITALLNSDIKYTKTGNPKGVSGDLANFKGFGWKFVRDNKKLMLEIEKEEDAE